MRSLGPFIIIDNLGTSKMTDCKVKPTKIWPLWVTFSCLRDMFRRLIFKAIVRPFGASFCNKRG